MVGQRWREAPRGIEAASPATKSPLNRLEAVSGVVRKGSLQAGFKLHSTQLTKPYYFTRFSSARLKTRSMFWGHRYKDLAYLVGRAWSPSDHLRGNYDGQLCR